jgi:chromosome segregation ATPase
VNNSADKNYSQAILWSLLGPWAIACIFLIVIFRSTHGWILPLIAFSGLLLCYQWQWRGFIFSTALLAAVLVYDFAAVPAIPWVWNSVLSLSIISAFALLSIGLNESRQVWESLTAEFKDIKDSFSALIRQQQVNQVHFQVERNTFESRINQLQSDIAAKDEKIKANHLLIGIVRQELNFTHEHRDKLMEELHEARRQTALLESQTLEKQLLESALSSVQRDLEALSKQEQQKNEFLETHHTAMQNLKATVERYEDELKQQSEKEKELQQQLEMMSQKCSQFDELQNTLHHANEQLVHLAQLQSDSQHLSAQYHQEKVHATALQEEKEVLALQLQKLLNDRADQKPMNESDREIQRIDGLYRQLRDQFNEKSSVLDATRRELFRAKEELAALRKEMEESKLYEEYEVNHHLSRLLASVEQELAGAESRYQCEIEQLHEVIESLIHQPQHM